VDQPIPGQLVVGDSWSWSLSLSSYPAPTWSVTCYFVKDGERFEVVSTADGTDHAFSVTSATSGARKPGRYRWTARATDGTSVVTLDRGWVDVLPNPATDKSDPRSWAAQTLAAIEAFLKGNATTAQQSMTLNGRSLSRWSLDELTKFRNELRAEVRGEDSAAKGGKGRVFKARFTRAQ
jgi:hypothetical protein